MPPPATSIVIRLAMLLALAFVACGLDQEGGASASVGGSASGGLGGAGGAGGSWPDATSGGAGGGGGATVDATDVSSDTAGDAADAPFDVVDSGDKDVVEADAADTSTVWDPSGIPNCALWLDADDTATVSISGSFVDSWKNKCASGDATASANQRPQYITINGKRALRFDGQDDALVITGAAGAAAEYTLFFVVNKNFASTLVRPVWSNRELAAGSGSTPTYVGFFKQMYVFQDLAVPSALVGTTDYDGTVVTLIYEYAVSSVGARELVANGAPEGAGTASNTTTVVPAGHLGFDKPNGQFAQMDLFEVVMFRRFLSPSERALVRAALKAKWAL